jgi:chaperonin GroES
MRTHEVLGTSRLEDRAGFETRRYGMPTATKVVLKPLEDRVVVKASEAEQTTASGIVIPDTAKEKPQEGTVIAVGPGRFSDQGERIPLDVKEGDVVVYSKYGGTEFKVAGEEYLILAARDILAILEK